MENKSLWKKDFEGREVKSIEVTNETNESCSVEFVDGGIITFRSHHDQDCCESVYADFSIIRYHKDEIVGKKVNYIEVKSVVGMGFLLVFNTGYSSFSKVFIGCYNYQNGYYSSDLQLEIEDNGPKTTIDISDCVEDHEG